MEYRFLPALGALLFVLTLSTAQAAGVMISDPWIRAAPPNAPALGAFMVINNHTEADIAVVAVRSSLSLERVELHRTMMSDGVMKMHPQKQIAIPAQGSVELKPGSWHVMLIGPAKVPMIGDEVALTIELSDGSEQTVKAVVRKGLMMNNHSHTMTSE